MFPLWSRAADAKKKKKSLIFPAVSALLIKASVSFSATNDLQTDRNQASLVFFTLCRVISLSAAATGSMWISESGAWNDMMMYTQSSWQTKSDGETRSCFLSGNRTSLSLCTEREKNPILEMVSGCTDCLSHLGDRGSEQSGAVHSILLWY